MEDPGGTGTGDTAKPCHGRAQLMKETRPEVKVAAERRYDVWNAALSLRIALLLSPSGLGRVVARKATAQGGFAATPRALHTPRVER